MTTVLRVLFTSLLLLAAPQALYAQNVGQDTSNALTSPRSEQSPLSPDVSGGSTVRSRVNSRARRIPMEIGSVLLHYAFWGGIALFNETVLDGEHLTAITFASIFSLSAGPVLAPGMIFTVGESAGGNGKLWATWIGSEIGRILFGAIGFGLGMLVDQAHRTGSYMPYGAFAGMLLGQAFGAPAGAILAYELSQE